MVEPTEGWSHFFPQRENIEALGSQKLQSIWDEYSNGSRLGFIFLYVFLLLKVLQMEWAISDALSDMVGKQQK